jgi:hypothetical protein
VIHGRGGADLSIQRLVDKALARFKAPPNIQ